MKASLHMEGAAFMDGTELKNILLLCRKRCRREKWLLCRIMKTVILMLKWEKTDLKVNVPLVLLNHSLKSNVEGPQMDFSLHAIRKSVLIGILIYEPILN